MSSPSPKYYSQTVPTLIKLFSVEALAKNHVLRNIPVFNSYVLRRTDGLLDDSPGEDPGFSELGSWSDYEAILRPQDGESTFYSNLQKYLGIAKPSYQERTSARADHLLDLVTSGNIYTDNRAVLKLTELLTGGGLGYVFEHDTEYEKNWEVVLEVARLQAYASRQNCDKTEAEANHIRGYKDAWELRYLARHLEHVFNLGRVGSYAKAFRLWKRGVNDELPEISPRNYQRVYRLASTVHYYRFDRSFVIQWREKLFVLSERDMKDLTETLVSLSNYQLYALDYARINLDGDIQIRYADAAKRIYKQFITNCEVASRNFELSGRVGTYFETLLSLYLAKKAGNSVVDNFEVMVEKFNKKLLNGFSSRYFLDSIEHLLPFKELVDLLHIYKCAPYAYFCPFYVVDRQYRLHHSLNQCGQELGEEEEEYFRGLEAITHYSFVQDFHEKYDYFPGSIRAGIDKRKWHADYPVKGIPAEFWRESRDIDLTGALPFLISDEMYVARMPDTASAPRYDSYFSSIDAYKAAPRYMKQNMLHILEDPEPINEERLWSELRNGVISFGMHIATGIRSERHKFDGRVFFIMNTPYKVCYSSLEQNIRSFVEGQVGIMIGKSNKEKMEDLEQTYKRRVPNTANLFISMDMDKWSPQMALRLQRLQHRFWAEVFNEKGIITLGEVIHNGTFFFRLGRTFRKYKNPGADLEGIRGTMLTYMHLCVMKLIIRTGKEKGLTKGASAFLTLIDDGLLRTGVPLGDNWNDRAKAFFEHMCFIYRAVGLRVSLDKTYVSRVMYVMLNEIYVLGMKIYCGLKALVKLGNYEKGPADSFADISNAHGATATGAVRNGCPPLLAYVIYTFECVRQMAIWAQSAMRCTNATSLALMMLVPVSLGGFGMISCLSLITNVVGSVLSRGVAFLRILAHYEPDNAQIAENLTNQCTEELKPMDFLRDPAQVHVVGERIRTQRVKVACLEAASRLATNKVLRDLLSSDTDDRYIQLADYLRAQELVTQLEVKCEWEKTKRAKAEAILSKFQRSEPIIELLGQRRLKAIRRAHRHDVVATLLSIHNRLAGVPL
jgi:hypothetical protein